MWFIYTMEYYTAEKNNDFMKFAGKWMELENVILSEINLNNFKAYWEDEKEIPLKLWMLNLNITGVRPGVCSVKGSQKKVTDALELEFQMF
ncbi:hypothetical protein STEG23_009307, partial [Scotinomys teguina]